MCKAGRWFTLLAGSVVKHLLQQTSCRLRKSRKKKRILFVIKVENYDSILCALWLIIIIARKFYSPNNKIQNDRYPSRRLQFVLHEWSIVMYVLLILYYFRSLNGVTNITFIFIRDREFQLKSAQIK